MDIDIGFYMVLYMISKPMFIKAGAKPQKFTSIKFYISHQYNFYQ